MKKKLIYSTIILMSSCFYLSGQGNSNWRGSILQKSHDTVLRVAIVDSIVNESFWDTNASYMKRYRDYYRKSDFSDYAKAKLLSYFNRSLPDSEIKKIADNVSNFIKSDIDKIHERSGLNYDSLYNIAFAEQFKKNIGLVLNRAYSGISPLYARFLGWLDYRPAIPVLESILQDSINNLKYAQNNKDEFVTSCKLALARMGNKQYQKELLNKYKTLEISCFNPGYTDFLQNIYYINNRESIDYVIQLSKNGKVYTEFDMYGLVDECSPQSIILIYLSKVIVDYPLEYEYPEIADITTNEPQMLFYETFYSHQFNKLSIWLEKNKKTYTINTKKLFLPKEF